MNHEHYIKRCLEISKLGIGTTRPNPSVGAVLVVDDRIIGEGFTSPYGGNHAEVNAISTVRDSSLLATATMYVTLEPCQMCAGALFWSQIATIVYGARDEQRGCINLNTKLHPKTKINGGVLAEESSQILKDFFIEKRNLN